MIKRLLIVAGIITVSIVSLRIIGDNAQQKAQDRFHTYFTNHDCVSPSRVENNTTILLKRKSPCPGET